MSKPSFSLGVTLSEIALYPLRISVAVPNGLVVHTLVFCNSHKLLGTKASLGFILQDGGEF